MPRREYDLRHAGSTSHFSRQQRAHTLHRFSGGSRAVELARLSDGCASARETGGHGKRPACGGSSELHRRRRCVPAKGRRNYPRDSRIGREARRACSNWRGSGDSEPVPGVDIDFENLRYEDQEPFSRFIEELAAELHPRGRLLSVTVQPKTRDRRSDSAGSPAMAKVMKSWRPRRTSTGRSRSDHPRSPAGRREGQRGERDSARSRDPSHTSRHADERVLSPRTARGRWSRECYRCGPEGCTGSNRRCCPSDRGQQRRSRE